MNSPPGYDPCSRRIMSCVISRLPFWYSPPSSRSSIPSGQRFAPTSSSSGTSGSSVSTASASIAASFAVAGSSGNTCGRASAQCCPSGIGSTSRSSRIAPCPVVDGYHHGVESSPTCTRFCQKMCTRAASLGPPPARYAKGTNPIASQNRFAARSCAHHAQHSRVPHGHESKSACNSTPATFILRNAGSTVIWYTTPTSSRLK